MRLPIVPLGTKVAASLPIREAATSRSRFVVGSSPNTSSPSVDSTIARRISGVGMVTVSERRSMNATSLLYVDVRADLILAGGRVRALGRRGMRVAPHIAIARARVIATGGAEVRGLLGPRTRAGSR